MDRSIDLIVTLLHRTTGLLRVLVEGGGVVLGQFFRAGVVDEAHWYLAPRFCGGGRLALEGEAWARSVEMSGVRILPLGDNVLVWGYPVWPGEGRAK